MTIPVEDEVIALFYEGALDPGKWREGLGALAKLSDARTGIALRHSFAQSKTAVLDNFGLDGATVAAYEQVQDLDPITLYARSAAPPPGRWLSDWQLVDPRDFARSIFYNEFMLKHDTHAVMANVAYQTQDFMASISMHRAPGQAAFGPQDEERLARITPHLTRASKMYFAATSLRDEGALASAVLAQVRVPVFAVNATGRLLLMSPAGQARVQSATHLRLSWNSHLCGTRSEAELARAIRLATSAQPRGTYLHLKGNVESPPVVACVVPLSPDAALASAWQQPLAIVLLEHHGSPADIEALLRELHCLTKAEARVAVRLFEGYSPADIADEGGTSVLTTRKQVKAIFQKLGARRQSEVSHLVGKLAGLVQPEI